MGEVGGSCCHPTKGSRLKDERTKKFFVFFMFLFGIGLPFLCSFLLPDSTEREFKKDGGKAEQTPYCYLESPDGIRAIKRAKTEFCRDEISRSACLSQNGTLYDDAVLENSCPKTIDESKVGLEYGCVSDSIDNRVLGEKLFRFKEDNSPKKCLEACTSLGCAFAGVQYGRECFCGNKEPKESGSGRKPSCNMPCPNPQDGICGGYLSMNVYYTGVLPFDPKKMLASDKDEFGDPPRIVFLFTVSGRSFRQIKRLIKRIYDPTHYYYIHVDSRQDYLYRELSSLSADNIQLVPNRYPTIWGGASLLRMLLSSMENLINKSSWKWDFVLNLSESDYPLKPLSELMSFLGKNRGRNFVKSHGRDPSTFIQKQGLQKTFFECENRMWRIGNRNLPKGISLDGGSDWICLYRDFVSYLVKNSKTDRLLSSLTSFYNYTLLPAESFFHTVLRNSKFCSTYVNNNLHLTNWKRKLGCKCQHKAVVDWCGCSPNDITPADWAKLKGTKEKQLFFVRKVEPVVSQTVLDLIDRELLLIKPEDLSDDRYWQNIYHHLDGGGYSSELFLAQSLLPSGVFLKEIHSYHRNDSLAGVLILYQNVQITSEAYVKPRSTEALIQIDESDEMHVEIGVGFDVKELIFRNFFKTFSSNTSVGVKLSYTSQKNRTATFFLFNPLGICVKAFVSHLNATSKHSKMSTFPPVKHEDFGRLMGGGLWRIAIMVDDAIKKGISFLVTEDSRPEIVADDPREVIRILKRHSPRELLQTSFPGEDISIKTPWRDLIKQYYPIVDFCGGESCFSTTWSSLSPDSKSELPFYGKKKA